MCGFQAPWIVKLSFEFSPQAIALDFVLDFDSLPRYNLYPQDSRMASVGNPSLGSSGTCFESSYWISLDQMDSRFQLSQWCERGVIFMWGWVVLNPMGATLGIANRCLVQISRTKWRTVGTSGTPQESKDIIWNGWMIRSFTTTFQ